MSGWRIVSTGAVLAAIAGCAVVVIGMAGAQPRPLAESSRPAPSPTSAASSDASGSDASGSESSSGEADLGATTSAATRSSAGAAPRSPAAGSAASSSVPTPRPRPSSAAVPARSASAAKPAPKAAPRPAPKPVPPPAPKPVAPPVRGQALPLGFSTGTATRVITVVAPSSGSTTATLQAWTKAPGGGWLRYGGPVSAHVGSQGLTTSPSEWKSATPVGSFGLTQAFGRAGNPGTGLPYFQTGWNDWWVSDTGSSLYNTHQRCSACSFDTGASENLYGAGYVYTYAVVIDYNRFPVRSGAGSAFFLHVTDGSSTAGCVSIPEGTLVGLMRWLQPWAHPRILIGVV